MVLLYCLLYSLTVLSYCIVLLYCLTVWSYCIVYCIVLLYCLTLWPYCIVLLQGLTVLSYCIVLLYCLTVLSYCIVLLYGLTVLSYCIVLLYCPTVWSYCMVLPYGLTVLIFIDLYWYQGEIETFTELNPWFLINALAEEAIICIKDAFQITSASLHLWISTIITYLLTLLRLTLHFIQICSPILNIAVFNSRSVRNKIESIIDHVVENDIGLCTVTETWLNGDDSASIAQLSVAGYFFKNFSRQSQNRGGGTGILFRDSVNVSLVDGKENNSFEYSEWIFKVHDRSMRHIIVYRPPYSSLHPVSASVRFPWCILSVFRECCYVPRGSCYLWRLQLSFGWPPWQWRQEIYGFTGNV